MKTRKSHRIEALDIFRALTMFFVNDIPGLKNIPQGLLQAAAGSGVDAGGDIGSAQVCPVFFFSHRSGLDIDEDSAKDINRLVISLWIGPGK